MRVVFDHWKYIFKNLWFVLPFAIMPSIFLALSVDFEGVHFLARKFFRADFDLEYVEILRAWSFFRFDSVLGAVYSVLAIVCIVIFSSLLLAFVEKHMRIGKRTLSGVFSQFGAHIWSFIGITLLFTAVYELWAVVLSAVLFAVAAIGSRGFACFLFVFVSLVFMGVLLFLISICYLWLPCMQITGFRAYGAFLYSYRLSLRARWRLILSMLITYAPCFLLIVGFSFTPVALARIVAFVMFVFAYLSFCVRMESLYFEMDKLDREDLLRSYREL